jgi:mannose-6-phosphate isomerase
LVEESRHTFRSFFQVSTMQVPLIRLQCGANSYDWGKKGNASAAARFAAATPSDDFTVQDDQPYAEAR